MTTKKFSLRHPCHDVLVDVTRNLATAIENVVNFYASISSCTKDTYEMGAFKNGQIRGCIVVSRL
jgi:hypothetical protein